jgi:hypothetical protein
MAIKRLTIDGYGQLELNQVAFRRDGRIEAQAKIAEGIDYVENGMLLAIDPVKRTVGYPTANEGLIALNYTTEHMYDERQRGLKFFKLDKDSVLPRLGYLAQGDKYTTNCIAYDDAEFASEDAVKAAVAACKETAVYGQPCENGATQITATKPEGAVALQVVEGTTMPNGTYGIKFISLK